MADQMTGWHISTAGGTAVYHCRGCTVYSTYAAHLMAAYDEGTIQLTNMVIIRHANKMAWPGILHNVDDVADQWWRKHVQSLEREIKDLKDVLDEERDVPMTSNMILKKNVKSQKVLSESSRHSKKRKAHHARQT